MNLLCVDACYLIALYDPSQEDHHRAKDSFEELFGRLGHRMILVWPIVYETLSTKMARRADRVSVIETDWKRLRATGQIEFIDDRPFRERALEESLAEITRTTSHVRALSLADRVMRRFLEKAMRVDLLLTFNVRDFSDVCQRRKIKIGP